MDKILDISVTFNEKKEKNFFRHECVLYYLKTLFPDISFVTDINEYRYIIGSETDITTEQKLEICAKLKLTSLHFVGFDHYVRN